MPYINFAPATVEIEGQRKRALKATCGRCGKTETRTHNTMRGHNVELDDDVIERQAINKFERAGWKFGKTLQQSRCPACFAAIKAANVRKQKEENVVVPINAKVTEELPVVQDLPVTQEQTVMVDIPRKPTRDEKRIIFQKIDENYVGEKVGYAPGWSDEKVATDLGVARAWVASIRDENFGPEIDSEMVRLTAEAKALRDEISALATSYHTAISEIIAKADRIDQALQGRA